MLDIGILLCSLIIAVGLHEGGHAAAGSLLGFRIQMFSIWPVCAHRARGTWHLDYSRRFVRGLSGFVGAYPLYATNLRIRTIGLISAGPISSAAAAGLCIWLANISERNGLQGASPLLRGIAVCSILCALASFLPSAKHGKSDGRQILEILCGKAAFLRLIAIWALTCPTSKLRPSQWDPGLVSLALNDAVCIGTTAELGSTVHWLRYNWCADTGRTACARDCLDWLLSERAAKADRLLALWEMVWFEVFSNNNVSAARERLEVAERSAGDSSSFMIWKAKAAISAAEGRQEEANSFAAEAISAIESESSISPGFSQAIKGNLNELLKRFKQAAPALREDIDDRQVSDVGPL